MEDIHEEGCNSLAEREGEHGYDEYNCGEDDPVSPTILGRGGIGDSTYERSSLVSATR